ncbi:MAG: GDP-mannose 4,6-dehydratase [Nitrososphaerota archaeon]|nr:GDP-mannose 4,6-dehydratase [Nitrososphaerota archaeon]
MRRGRELNLAGKSILVTGGAGFIGSQLTEELLETGANVTVYDNFDKFYRGKEENLVEASRSPAFTLVRGDIRDFEVLSAAMKGKDVVIHEAGQAGVGISVDDPKTTDEVNVMGTLNVLWGARVNGVKRVVNASSSSIFGQPNYLPIDEGHVTNPASPYGVSKLAAEQYGKVFSKVYGLEVVSLRYFSVYGPRGRPDQVIRKFMRSLVEKKPPGITGDGSHTRDFTHVSDIVSATIGAAQTDGIGGEVFNIGFGARTSILSVAEKLIALSGLEGKVRPDFGPPSKGDFPDTQADNRKARKVLGWEPKVDLDRGLQEYVEWFLAARKKGDPRA